MPRQDVTGFLYHCVSDERVPHVQHLHAPEPVARFEAALLYMKSHFTPVSAAQIAEARRGGQPLPPNALHLSFDDAFVECYTVVRPMLLKHSIPCTFFITMGWVDNASMFYLGKASLCIEQMNSLERDAAKMVLTSLNNALDLSLGDPAGFARWIVTLGAADEGVIDMAARMLGVDVKAYLAQRKPYLTTEQLRQLQADGFSIGAHTITHPYLNTLPRAEAEAEILDSVRALQALCGEDVVDFAVPFSTPLDRGWLADLRRRNPALGLIYDGGWLQADADFIVNRIWAEEPGYRGVGDETNLPELLEVGERALKE